MSIRDVMVVLESQAEMTSSERHILLEMAYQANARREIRASQVEVAQATHLSRKAVVAAYLLFDACSLIEHSRPGHGRFRKDALAKIDNLMDRDWTPGKIYPGKD